MPNWIPAQNIRGLFDQKAGPVSGGTFFWLETSTLVDYLTFRRMITPIIIQILFCLGVIVFVLGGLFLVSNREVVIGLLTLVVGPIAVRIYCELLILFFRMNETLTEIRNNTARSKNP